MRTMHFQPFLLTTLAGCAIAHQHATDDAPDWNQTTFGLFGSAGISDALKNNSETLTAAIQIRLGSLSGTGTVSLTQTAATESCSTTSVRDPETTTLEGETELSNSTAISSSTVEGGLFGSDTTSMTSAPAPTLTLGPEIVSVGPSQFTGRATSALLGAPSLSVLSSVLLNLAITGA